MPVPSSPERDSSHTHESASGERPSPAPRMRDLQEHVDALRRRVAADRHRLRELEESEARRDIVHATRTRYFEEVCRRVRSPLNAVHGFSELLLLSTLDAEQRGAIERLHRAAVQLSGIVEDLVMVAAEAAPVCKSEPVRVDRVLEQALYDRDAELHIDAGVPTRVVTDGHRLRQAVGRVADLGASLSRKAAVAVEVEFLGGPGELRVLVRPDDPAATAADDTLRLAVDPIVEALGGTLSAREDGLVLRVPVAAARESEHASPKLAGLRVVLAISEPSTRARLQRRAEALGLLTQEAATADAARRAAETADLVVIDDAFLDGGGLALARALRRSFGVSELPVVVFGSLIDPELLPGVVVSNLSSALSEAEFAELLERAAAQRARAALPRTLVVEDDPVNQALALNMLRALGVRADLASNGREAVERIREHDYDVILLDVMMPEVDGLTAARMIREETDRREHRPYLVAVTALARPRDRKRCLDAGMDDYISKPYRLNTLADALSLTQVRASA